MSRYRDWSSLFLLIFVIIAGASGMFFNYAFLKLLIWVVGALLISRFKPKLIFLLLMLGGVLESAVAFLQFYWQKSLGLGFLGESLLEPFNLEVARTYLGEGGGLLLRAYGTLPHPNILASFLILSLISAYYFFLKVNQPIALGETQQSQKVLASRFFGKVGMTATIFILWLGILLTFSRAGWLIAFLVSAIFLLSASHFGFNKKVLWKLSVTVLITIAVLISIFYWAVIPRVTTLTPDSFTVQPHAKKLACPKINLR